MANDTDLTIKFKDQGFFFHNKGLFMPTSYAKKLRKTCMRQDLQYLKELYELADHYQFFFSDLYSNLIQVKWQRRYN